MKLVLALVAALVFLAGISEAQAQAKCLVPPVTAVGKCLQKAGARCNPAVGWVGGNEASRRACLGQRGTPGKITLEGCPTKTFCTGWQTLCDRIGGRPVECRRRYTECLSSQCFYFESPRPRCRNNPEDLALTTICQVRR